MIKQPTTGLTQFKCHYFIEITSQISNQMQTKDHTLPHKHSPFVFNENLEHIKIFLFLYCFFFVFVFFQLKLLYKSSFHFHVLRKDQQASRLSRKGLEE